MIDRNPAIMGYSNGGVGESLAALLNGRVDVAMVGYPYGLRAENAGFQLLFRPSQTEYGLFPNHG